MLGPPSPPGTDGFTITVYFNMNAGGAALDTAATLLTITEGTTNNSGTVTLEGIPAFVTINSVPAAGTWSAGATNSTTLTITAQDASEETITGTYANPITLSDPDETNVGTFVEASTCPTLPGSGPPSNVYPSGTSFTFTASGQTAKFCYLGYAEPAQTLTASSTAATAYATFTPGYNTPVEGATSPASISGPEPMRSFRRRARRGRSPTPRPDSRTRRTIRS